MNLQTKSLADSLKSPDKNKVIRTLVALRNQDVGKKSNLRIDPDSFRQIISFLKQPNHKLLSYSISILANCCVRKRFIKEFKESEGIPDLLLILKIMPNDDIVCRAWRLVGNLARSCELSLALLGNGLDEQIVAYLSAIESFSPDSKSMIYRALGKCWSYGSLRKKIASLDFISTIKTCLESENSQTVNLTLQFLGTKNSLDSNIAVDKFFLTLLVSLSKKEELYEKSVDCLTNVILHHSISSLLEGSGVVEVFIAHLKNDRPFSEDFLKAFLKLCSEGAVRNKVKNSNLLPILLRLCIESKADQIILIFLHFQYDKPSIEVLSQSTELINILIDKVPSSRAVKLLSLIARLDRAVPGLVTQQSLEIFTSHEACKMLLAIVTSKRQYFTDIVLSGMTWAVNQSGCSLEEVGSSWFGEGVVEHWLLVGDQQKKRIVALAVPFLVKPRQYTLLYQFLARNNALNIILEAFQETPTEQSVVAAVVRMAMLFRTCHREVAKLRDLSGPQVMFLEQQCSKKDAAAANVHMVRPEKGNCAVVTFELDDGTTVKGNRTLLCAQSPVLDAMLNGHFSEAGQEQVRLADCSHKALSALIKLLNGQETVRNLGIHVHLELILLCDRFLLTALGDALTREVDISGVNCAEVYLWSQNAGDTTHVAHLRARAYWAMLSSPQQLIPALHLVSCRDILIQDISSLLFSCVNDIL